MSNKKQKLMYLLQDLCDGGFDKECYVGVHQGRKVRLNRHGNVDIGDTDFDRWANSIEITIYTDMKKFPRQFEQAFKQLTGDKDE